MDVASGVEPSSLNYDGPTADQVVERLRKYLETPILAEDSGWPDLTREQLVELYEMFYDILEAKIERDCDNDMVIQFEIGNRKKHALYAVRIPHEIQTPENLRDHIRELGMMSGIIDQALRRLDYEIYDQMNFRGRVKRIQPLLTYAAKAGAWAAYERLEAVVQSGNRLYVGKKADVWGAFKLSLEEFESFYRGKTIEDQFAILEKALGKIT